MHVRANRTGPLVVAPLAAAGLLALTLLVATGAADAVDRSVRLLFRPDDEWGDAQIRVDGMVNLLSPQTCVAVLAVVAAVVALRRRSWRPLVRAAATALAAGLLTVGLQLLVGRPDTHGDVSSLGGSYPSGHVAMILVAGGCLALLRRGPPGAIAWSLAVSPGVLLAWAILVQTGHWFTDVLGAVLVAALVLSLAARLPADERRRDAPSLMPSHRARLEGRDLGHRG